MDELPAREAGKARQGKARQGKARQGKAREGKARQGKARQGKARQGKGKQGKAKQLKVQYSSYPGECTPNGRQVLLLSKHETITAFHTHKKKCSQPPWTIPFPIVHTTRLCSVGFVDYG